MAEQNRVPWGFPVQGGFQVLARQSHASCYSAGDSSALRGLFGLDGLQRCLTNNTSLVLIEL